MYDEAYQKYLEDKARKALEELLSMSDEERASILSGVPEEETVQLWVNRPTRYGYTNKEGKL